MRVDLRKALFILPNLFTLSSIFCGFFAIVSTFGAGGDERFVRASVLIIFAAFFDTVDGRVARLTKTQSAFGVQIDSLADVASFGVAPSLLVYEWSLSKLGNLGLALSFAFLACGAIRLARFNVLAMGEGGAPKKPSSYIVGLPIPGAAAVLVALILAHDAMPKAVPGPDEPAVVAVIIGLLSLLMVSTVPFRSFKNLRASKRTIIGVVFAIGSTVAIAVSVSFAFALLWMVTGYVSLALIEGGVGLATRATRKRAEKKAPKRVQE